MASVCPDRCSWRCSIYAIIWKHFTAWVWRERERKKNKMISNHRMTLREFYHDRYSMWLYKSLWVQRIPPPPGLIKTFLWKKKKKKSRGLYSTLSQTATRQDRKSVLLKGVVVWARNRNILIKLFGYFLSRLFQYCHSYRKSLHSCCDSYHF